MSVAFTQNSRPHFSNALRYQDEPLDVGIVSCSPRLAVRAGRCDLADKPYGLGMMEAVDADVFPRMWLCNYGGMFVIWV